MLSYILGIIFISVKKRNPNNLHPSHLIQDVIGCINVQQYNCHLSDCPVTLSCKASLERQATSVKTVQVENTNDRHFIINIASLSNPQLHCEISKLSYHPISPDQWVQCVTSGFQTWAQTSDEDEMLSSEEEDAEEDDDQMDPEFEYSDYSSDVK